MLWAHDFAPSRTFVYAKEATQQEVYSACAAEMVDAVIEGTNACIFAFGSTGAGKTHSMLGPEGGRRQAKQDGILPRAAAELFRRIARSEAEAKAAIGAGGFSAYEVRAAWQNFRNVATKSSKMFKLDQLFVTRYDKG